MEGNTAVHPFTPWPCNNAVLFAILSDLPVGLELGLVIGFEQARRISHAGWENPESASETSKHLVYAAACYA